ncbi:MAG: hypothetical protein IPI50_10170 [Saprospiraceae bacterium]|nr:hypothetical protein [Saprospiraceae bacterium]
MLLRETFDYKLSFKYTGKYLFQYLILSVLVAGIYYFTNLKWLQIPFLPIGMLGTAVAFFVGFKNNSAYDRHWEARKLWGGFTNVSRNIALQIFNYLNDRHQVSAQAEIDLLKEKTKILYRQIAYIHCVRMNLRETMNIEELQSLLSSEEFEELKSKNNRPNFLLQKQSEHLEYLAKNKSLEHFFHIELMQSIKELLDIQGGCERIKNTPFPRQYANYSRLFTKLFCFILPFGISTEFIKTFGIEMVWLAIPFSAIICWIFMAMEIIGSNTEKPFANIAASVNINTISRNIERDIREILGEIDLPPALVPINYISM